MLLPWPALLVLVACNDPAREVEDDTAAGGDTASTDDTALPAEVDADGDGAPDWRTAHDPARADCDDDDPAVNPATEVYVPAGPFTRGDADTPWAETVRSITLGAYCIDRTEVTNEAFRTLLVAREAEGSPNADEDGHPLYDVDDQDDIYPERLQFRDGAWSVEDGYARHPVVEVWWWSAAYYCGRSGRSLPSEAQWEKAARGSADARRWPWGDAPPTCARANFVDVPPGTSPAGQPACVGDTTPVGTYTDGTSPSGAADMAGNVAEWVNDWFDPEAYDTGPDTDPTGPAEGQTFDDGVGTYVARVARGGNFLQGPDDLTVSARFPEPFDATSNGLGFRCARSLEEGVGGS